MAKDQLIDDEQKQADPQKPDPSKPPDKPPVDPPKPTKVDRGPQRGYFVIPADKLTQINEQCEQAGLGPGFFSIPLEADGKISHYAAAGTLSRRDWLLLSEILKAETDSIYVIKERPSKAGFESVLAEKSKSGSVLIRKSIKPVK